MGAKRRSSVSKLGDVPSEQLLAVLNLLSIADLRSLYSVCRRFRRLVQSYCLLQKKLDLIGSQYLEVCRLSSVTDSQLSSLHKWTQKRYSNIRSLRVSLPHSLCKRKQKVITKQLVRWLESDTMSSAFVNLRNVDCRLSNPKLVTSVCKSFFNFRLITTLRFVECKILHDSVSNLLQLIQTQSDSLEVLELKFETRFRATLKDILLVSLTCPNLRVLTLVEINFNNYDESAIPSAEKISVHSTNLYAFHYVGTRFYQTGILESMINNCCELRRITLECDGFPDDYSLSILSNWIHPEFLCISPNVHRQTHEEGLFSPGFVIEFLRVNGIALQELELGQRMHVGVAVLRTIGTYCKNLRRFTATLCHRNGAEAFQYLLSKCNKMETVTLYDDTVAGELKYLDSNYCVECVERKPRVTVLPISLIENQQDDNVIPSWFCND